MIAKGQLWKTIAYSLILRIAIIVVLGNFQQVEKGEIFFTDIDYKVFSDSAKYPTPYGRHTYRYTPLLSYMMSLNYTVYQSIGKIIFCLFDGLAIYFLWHLALKLPAFKADDQKQRLKWQQQRISQADFIAQLYGYNPLFVYLTVRGSCQSISLTLMYGFWFFIFGKQSSGNLVPEQIKSSNLEEAQSNFLHKVYAYVFYGLWVHFRLYPIIFLPLILLYEHRNYVNQTRGKFWMRFTRMGLIAGGTFMFLFVLFYSLYGEQFVKETYWYHLSRKDNRHSFSPFFYDIYLHFFEAKPLRILPSLIFILVMISTMSKYYSMFYLHFLITFAFVQFNTVITLQYYQWVFGALLLVLPESRIITFKQYKKGFNLMLQWFLGVAIWIWMSIKIEKQGQNILFALWVICLCKIMLDLWVLLQFMKTVKVQDQKQIKKIRLESAKEILSGRRQNF